MNMKLLEDLLGKYQKTNSGEPRHSIKGCTYDNDLIKPFNIILSGASIVCGLILNPGIGKTKEVDGIIEVIKKLNYNYRNLLFSLMRIHKDGGLDSSYKIHLWKDKLPALTRFSDYVDEVIEYIETGKPIRSPYTNSSLNNADIELCRIQTFLLEKQEIELRDEIK